MTDAKKRQIIFVGIVLFIFFCLFLFYARLEIQRIIAVRVRSAIEVSQTSNQYLNFMGRATANVGEDKE